MLAIILNWLRKDTETAILEELAIALHNKELRCRNQK